MAQTATLAEPFSNIWTRRPFIYGTPAGQDNDNLYFAIHGRAFDMFKPKTWTDHFYTVSKESMQTEGDIAVTVSAKHDLLGALVTENSIIALYSSLNKKGDQAILTIANLDKGDKAVTLSDANSVSTAANSNYWPAYKTAKSPDGKMMASLVVITGKDSKLENLFAAVVNDQGEFLWSGTFNPEFGGKTFSLGNLTLDNEGNLYIPAYTCQKTGKNISDVRLMIIKVNDSGSETFSEGVSFGTPQNFTSKTLSNGKVAMAGYYTESNTNTATQSSGYFFYIFDPKAESFSEQLHFKFADNYVEKSAWARFATVLGNQQYYITADNIFELENGSIVLCGEHRFLKSIYNAQMKSYSYQMLTKNILVSTLHPDGTADFTMVGKQQAGSLGIYPPDDWKGVNISYSAFAHGNDMYFLFNDDLKNIPYPGKDVVCSIGGLSFKKKWESVLMRLTPDQQLTQRVLKDPNQLLRGVEFTDGENFYASGIGKSQFFLTKLSVF